jgi:hypothetical protein
VSRLCRDRSTNRRTRCIDGQVALLALGQEVGVLDRGEQGADVVLEL